MELLTRVESHASDLFKLQDVPGGVLARPKRAFPKPPADGGSAPKKLGKASEGGKGLGGSEDAGGMPPNILAPPRRLPKSKTTINLATIAEEEPMTMMVAPSLAGESKDDTAGEPVKKKDASSNWITTRSLTSDDIAKIHYEDVFGCFTRNFGKGAALGFFGKVGVNVFLEVIGIMRRRGLPTTPLLPAAVDGAKEHGIFLGLLLSVFNSFMYVTRKAPMPYSRYRGAMAGALSGLCSMWALPGSMRRSALLFLSVRAFELACRVGARRGIFPTLPNGDTLLMSAASALMIHLWMLHPGTLDPSYVHFLQRQVQFNSAVVRGVAAMQQGLPLDIEEVNKARALFVPPALPITDPLIYDKLSTAAEKGAFLLHPTQPFSRFAVRYFLKGLQTALPVYLPVYVVPLVIFSHKRLLSKPVDTLLATAQGVATSTVFLATYCTLGITSISLFRTLGARYDVLGPWAVMSLPMSGALAGLATVIEKKNRRIELALYVLQRALDGLHKAASKKFGEKVANPMLGDSVLFAALLAMIFHANLRHADLVRPAYRSFLTRFFDTDERHQMF